MGTLEVHYGSSNSGLVALKESGEKKHYQEVPLRGIAMIRSIQDKNIRNGLALTSSLMIMLVVGLDISRPAWSAESSHSDEVVESQAAAELESNTSKGKEAPLESFFSQTTVTATGSEVDVFTISTPVTVIRAEEIQRKIVNNAAER